MTRRFWVAIADNLPAVLFLFAALALAYRREKNSSLLLAAACPALTLIASTLQLFQVGVHPLYFNHNAVYHVFLFVAFLMFFRGGRRLIGGERTARRTLSRAD